MVTKKDFSLIQEESNAFKQRLNQIGRSKDDHTQKITDSKYELIKQGHLLLELQGASEQMQVDLAFQKKEMSSRIVTDQLAEDLQGLRENNNHQHFTAAAQTDGHQLSNETNFGSRSISPIKRKGSAHWKGRGGMTVSERTEFRELEESVKQMTFTQKRIETGLKQMRPDEINKQITEIK